MHIAKPKALYHASQKRNISVFEPKIGKVRDPKEGAVVFATSDKSLSTVFLVPTDDSWTKSGLFGGVHFFVCSDRERFESLDKGGAIYTLPSDTFETDPNKGLRTREWTSKLPVRPLEKEECVSALEVMLSYGVQVYFVNKEVFKAIEDSDDYGNLIIRNLKSENKSRNINPRKIPQI